MTDDPTETLDKFSGALVLVVDDEGTQRLLTRDTLEQDGFRVEEAPSGEIGLERIRELRPDLVLLDVMMPGIDGFEVCRQLRADLEICHTPVIIISGREDTEDINKGFAVGATDFLTKPVIWNLLPSRVRFVLRTKRLEQDLRAATEVAERASEAKSALLATMGHELRTPLNAIIGFSDMMRQSACGPLGSPQYEEFVGHMYDSGMRLSNAINAILEIVSCEAGTIELDQQEIGVAGLVESVVARLESDASDRGIRIVNDIVDTGVCIDGDEARLRDALYNLVSNAVKFTETGGTVTVTATLSESGELVLAIADTGIGITAEDLPRVMKPFEQADSSLSRQYEGLGLGIPLAIAVAQMHGGNIDYESDLGRGTTVRTTLPAQRITISDGTVPARRAQQNTG
ncbi:MAG: hybrid sensor histidine kinase/response regulator [Rhodospirillaceae bacterium]|jgi:signal transduction histidine kinase|nr:hybrid sensor histidine kinase/response regulator [Rhodospirillaceae bacterium]